MAAAIPILAPADDDRRLREGSRGLNTYITGAQARAIATNRPFGIALKRLAQDTNRDEDRGVCLEVFYVEQQPPYAGFDANSRVCVALHPDVAGLVLVRFVTRGSGTTGASLPVGWMADLFPTGMIRPGDVIETGGTLFELALSADSTVTFDQETGYFGPPPNQNTTSLIVARPINDSGQQINPTYDDNGSELRTNSPAPYWTRPAPYKILRQATLASDEPYQLPEGTAIDLRASGVGSDDYFYVPSVHDNNDWAAIMFSPEGSISTLRYNQKFGDESVADDWFDEPIVDNVYLLVGKRENVPVPLPDNDPTLKPVASATRDEERQKMKEPINWLSGISRWVVIGSQSGRIVTVENAFVDLPEVTTMAPSEALRNQQILAAREFTREMSQLGGR